MINRTRLILIICIAIVIGCIVGCAPTISTDAPVTSKRKAERYGESWDEKEFTLLAQTHEVWILKKPSKGELQFGNEREWLEYDSKMILPPVGQIKIERYNYWITFRRNSDGSLMYAHVKPSRRKSKW